MAVGDSWPLVWVEIIDGATLTLRLHEKGEGEHYHDVEAHVGSAPIRWDDSVHGHRVLAAIPTDEYAADPRWPTVCDCGHEFTADATRQVNQAVLYAHPDVGLRTERTLPVGSIRDVWWGHWRHPDGLSVGITIPRSVGYPWMIEYPASSCEHDRRGSCCWTRSGDPRHPKTFTASPSILTPDFHGVIQPAGTLLEV